MELLNNHEEIIQKLEYDAELVDMFLVVVNKDGKETKIKLDTYMGSSLEVQYLRSKETI